MTLSCVSNSSITPEEALKPLIERINYGVVLAY